MTAASLPNSPPSITIPPTRLAYRTQQTFLRTICCDLFIGVSNSCSKSRCNWFILLNRHDAQLFYYQFATDLQKDRYFLQQPMKPQLFYTRTCSQIAFQSEYSSHAIYAALYSCSLKQH